MLNSDEISSHAVVKIYCLMHATILWCFFFFSKSQLKKYMVHIYDHNGLFEGSSSVSTLSFDLLSDLNLVAIV